VKDDTWRHPRLAIAVTPRSLTDVLTFVGVVFVGVVSPKSKSGRKLLILLRPVFGGPSWNRTNDLLVKSRSAPLKRAKHVEPANKDNDLAASLRAR
jgi:hypothetical protein